MELLPDLSLLQYTSEREAVKNDEEKDAFVKEIEMKNKLKNTNLELVEEKTIEKNEEKIA